LFKKEAAKTSKIDQSEYRENSRLESFWVLLNLWLTNQENKAIHYAMDVVNKSSDSEMKDYNKALTY